MKPALLASVMLALAVSGQALAETSAPVEQATLPSLPSIEPVRHGYAFDDPDLLLRQQIFGLAHSIHLLLSACLDKAEDPDAVQQAYATWHPAQESAIEASYRSLAAHHYGALAERATWQDVARLFKLKETIYPSLGSINLQDACASFPEALRQPRYDFAAQLEKSNDNRGHSGQR